MYIDYNIENYIIDHEASILETLKKIDAVKGRIRFVINSLNECVASITNGDILRWLINNPKPDLDVSVAQISNKNFKYASVNAPKDQLKELLKDFRFVPILDSKKKIIGIAQKSFPNEGLKIGDKIIGLNSPCFIISEIGNNHNGCIEEAKRLIDRSVEAGADCAKFQMRQMGEIYSPKDSQLDSEIKNKNLGTEYTLDLLSKVQLKNDELYQVFDYCREVGIIPLCTPWDKHSLSLLNDYGLDAFKFASADLTNHPLILEGIETRKPLLLSTGMSLEKEIISTVRLLEDSGTPFCLLHCNSTYPAPFDSLNLNYIKHLKELVTCPIGYSGHERGINSSIAAVVLGAKVIERHITTNKEQEGSDHGASLLPKEFKSLVSGIREIEQSLGSSNSREVGQGEMMNRSNLAKSIHTNATLYPGEIITEDNLFIKSPGHGLQPCYINNLIGITVNRTVSEGECFYPSDLKNDLIEPRIFSFKRPWGIPVRFHDASTLIQNTSPDFVEFHLSYKDLEVDFKSMMSSNLIKNFVIHCPELFAEDHILDLCSTNENYREHSIEQISKVLKLTRRLKDFFKVRKEVQVVVNVGGFTRDKFMDKQHKPSLYRNLESSLQCLDLSGVEIIPQTMPPFPWHFGGQRFHNLFVEYDEIVTFCKRNMMRICLDVSHSKLACAHSKTSFFKFCHEVAPYVSHLHIADSKGTDGEGMQIGEGEIDFKSLTETLNQFCPNASFIPEVWQGHENNGEGFWRALDDLEKNFLNY